jgi:hypothetical protein
LIAVGPKPSPELTLDRIDVNGNYEPGNVRWIPWSQQLSNRRPYKHKGKYKRNRKRKTSQV